MFTTPAAEDIQQLSSLEALQDGAWTSTSQVFILLIVTQTTEKEGQVGEQKCVCAVNNIK